jgi:hypothetical protein
MECVLLLVQADRLPKYECVKYCCELTCVWFGNPVESIRLATFTVLPQMSYWGFLAPITPATTGPMLIPETCNFSYFISQPKQRNCTFHSLLSCISQILIRRRMRIKHYCLLWDNDHHHKIWFWSVTTIIRINALPSVFYQMPLTSSIFLTYTDRAASGFNFEAFFQSDEATSY